MKIYLVDFENVKSRGLTGIDSLDENDTVIIFYSENSDTISFEMHQKVLTSKAKIEYFKEWDRKQIARKLDGKIDIFVSELV